MVQMMRMFLQQIDLYYHSTDINTSWPRQQVIRSAVIGALMLWITFITFILVMHYPECVSLLYSQSTWFVSKLTLSYLVRIWHV